MKKQSIPDDPILKIERYDDFLKTFPRGNVDYDGETLNAYLETIISQIAEPRCEPEDVHNNLLRLIMLLYQADDTSRWAITHRLIDSIYKRSNEYAQSCARQVQLISREIAQQAKGGKS